MGACGGGWPWGRSSAWPGAGGWAAEARGQQGQPGSPPAGVSFVIKSQGRGEGGTDRPGREEEGHVGGGWRGVASPSQTHLDLCASLPPRKGKRASGHSHLLADGARHWTCRWPISEDVAAPLSGPGESPLLGAPNRGLETAGSSPRGFHMCPHSDTHTHTHTPYTMDLHVLEHVSEFPCGSAG